MISAVLGQSVNKWIGGRSHSMHQCHNPDWAKATHLFDLFEENRDEEIIQFSELNNDFTINCYIAGTFDVTADAFLLSILFKNQNVFQKLMETNAHKLDVPYSIGFCESKTPREWMAEIL